MHYISDKFPGVNRKYAISLRAEEDFEGVYRWQYRDGRTEIPDYFVWGNGHPRDKVRTIQLDLIDLNYAAMKSVSVSFICVCKCII